MITYTKSYKVSDGTIFPTLEAAQARELELIFENTLVSNVQGCVKIILENKAKIIDVLTTNQNSKPRARSINGGTKARKTVVTDSVSSVNSTNNT